MTVRPAAALAALLAAAAGCDDDCCTLVDSFPIPLTRVPMGGPLGGDGALVANAERPDAPGAPFQMLIATGSPVTVLAGDASGSITTQRGGFDLVELVDGASHTRARFRDLSMLRLPLGMVGGDGGGIVPGGVLGGDLLRRYSVDIRFTPPPMTTPPMMPTPPSMTLWGHLGADLAFLQDAGYAVIRFSPFGGGETTAEGDADFLGQRGPLVLPPTRIVLRACAVARDFTPDMPRDTCCTVQDAARLATGVDLSVMIDTGLGPLVLGQSAWERVSAAANPPPPVPVPGTLSMATWPTPIVVGWSTIPRYALVDLELGPTNDPGPCVELERAHRTEQVSYQVAVNMAQDICAQPCDTDPRNHDLAQSSAAYLEISGQIQVAVIADEDPFLQALRFDIRPEGPELDGIVGAGALGRSRVEIDYRSSPARAVFSCELGALRSECFAGARCPRLPNQGDTHLCFGLPRHSLAPSCAPSGC